jgi:hypothetical protein
MARAARAKAHTRGRARVLRGELMKRVRDPLLLSLAALVVLSTLEAYVWIGALISELGLLLALAVFLLSLFLALKRQHVRALVLAACALFFARGSLPHLRGSRPTPEHGPTLRILQAHAAEAGLSLAQVARLLAQSDADVASLTGLAPHGLRGQSSFESAGYDRVAAPDGAQLLLIKRTLHAPARAGSASFVRLGRCQVEIVQVDLPSLFAPTALSERRRRIARLARSQREPRRIFVGHFGSRSEASDLAPLRDSQELRDVRLGHGRLATAPALLGPMGLPVDQILLHGWILARGADAEPPLAEGMHRTLSATLELTEPRCAPKEPARR